jgi:hypothetical protein
LVHPEGGSRQVKASRVLSIADAKSWETPLSEARPKREHNKGMGIGFTKANGC